MKHPVINDKELLCRALRKNLHYIAMELGHERLAETALGGRRRLESIVLRIIETGDVKPIAKKFFEDFPGRNAIIRTILTYENKPEALRVVMEGVGDALYALFCWDNSAVDIGNVKDAARAFGQKAVRELAAQYHGRALRAVMNCVGDVAHFHRGFDVVKSTAEALRQKAVRDAASQFSGKELEVVMRGIGHAVHYTYGNAVAVRNVAQIATQYKGRTLEELEVLMRGLYNTCSSEAMRNDIPIANEVILKYVEMRRLQDSTVAPTPRSA